MLFFVENGNLKFLDLKNVIKIGVRKILIVVKR